MPSQENTFPIKIKASALNRVKQHGWLLDSLEESASAKFYDNLFSEHREISAPELYAEVKERHATDGSDYRKMESIVRDLRTRLAEDAVVLELGGGVHQNRSGNATHVFKQYVPVDISRSSIRRYCETYDKPGVVADAADLPFDDNSADCVFTHTFLEHPLHPQKVLEEIIRIVKPGGIVVHNDAWFCRWWQRYGIVGLKRFSSMSARERVIRVLAGISEVRLFRIPPIVFRRAWRMTICRNDATLDFNRLKPNYDLLLGCDEDAATSLDPIEVMRFYGLHGFDSLKQLTFCQMLLHPNDYIIVQKSR